MEPGTILTGVGMCVAGVAYAVRMEGKINSLNNLIEERKDQANERHNDIKAALIRIENKIDNGIISNATKDIRK